MDDFRKVRPGAPLRITARAWNRIVDTVTTKPALVGEQTGFGIAPNVVLIKNTSGHVVPRFGVLGITGVEILPSSAANPTQAEKDRTARFVESPVLTGSTPYTAQHADRFVVAMEPIADGAVGVAAVSGVFACKVNVTSTNHRFASVKNNDRTQLASAACGVIQLLWVENQTGANRWAVGVM